MNKFWTLYERKYNLALYVTTVLFLIQLVHLYWMTTDVVMFRLFGRMFWDVSDFWQLLIALADYTEIPAIITASIFYIHKMRPHPDFVSASPGGRGKKWRSMLMIIFVNTQWLHLFWITDEIIYAQFTGSALVYLPIWLSWTAIAIDYLELPVMFDTVRESIKSLQKARV